MNSRKERINDAFDNARLSSSQSNRMKFINLDDLEDYDDPIVDDEIASILCKTQPHIQYFYIGEDFNTVLPYEDKK